MPLDQAREALNVHFYEGGLGTKRGGSSDATFSGLSGHNALYRHVPGQDETAAEFWLVDNSATNKILRVAGGSSASSMTLTDNIQANDTEISWATLNGKLYIAYNSSVNRLHVFDPNTSTTKVRRSGLKAPAAPSAANTGSGSYAAVLRYYKVAYRIKSGSTVIAQSELGASVSFTPSGSGTHARVTKPASTSEDETHWVLFGSADNLTYYELAETVVGTTTYDDNETVADYDLNEAEPPAGTHTVWPSVKYLYSNGNRLFGFGVWETSAGDSVEPRPGRVYFGPVLDSRSAHDDERFSNVNGILVGTLDISRNAGSVDRGLNGLGNIIYTFQSVGVHALVPTENEEVPYRRVQISGRVGAITNESIVKGIDQYGRECLYFADPVLGPYRIGQDGVQWVGKDVKDLWDTLNRAAANKVCWAVYMESLNCIIYAIATGANDDPNKFLVFDVTEGWPDEHGDIRGGWSVWDGLLCGARCGVMYSTTVGATMSRDLTLYTGKSSSTVLYKYNPALTSDDSTAFQAYVESGAFGADEFELNKQVLVAWLAAQAASGVTITQTFIRNSGDETNRTSTALLTAGGSETDVRRKFEATALQDAAWFQVRLGDASATASAWTILRWVGDLKGSGDS